MSENKIKIVAFDLDNTLYNEGAYFEAVIAEFCKQYNCNEKLYINNFYSINRDSGDVFAELLKRGGIYTPELQQCFFKIYQTISVKLSLFPATVKLLDCLKKLCIRTAIITNGNLEAQENKIKCLGIGNLFDVIIYARRWGKDFEKPHSRSYQFLLEYFSCSPEEVLFVGDKEETDIVGAINLGIHAVRIDDEMDINSITRFLI
jgi:putative hydrolase of the HAD superfamily